MLTRCIHHIASKKRAEEAEDYELDFEVAGNQDFILILHVFIMYFCCKVNLPKPDELMARLMVRHCLVHGCCC